MNRLFALPAFLALLLLTVLPGQDTELVAQIPPQGEASSVAQLAELGEAARKAGDPDKALKVYSEVIAKDPTFVIGYYGRALAFMDKKQFVFAILDLDSAIKLRARVPAFHFNRAIAHYETGKFSAAAADLSMFLQL